MRVLLPALILPVLLAGCATSGDKQPEPKGIEKFADDPRLGDEVKRLCFASSIDSFGNNDGNTFTVREGMDHYLIEVYGSCFNLDHAERIAIDATGSCLTKGDAIIVSDSISSFDRGTPGSTQRCVVKSMHAWDPQAEAASDAEAEAETPAEE